MPELQDSLTTPDDSASRALSDLLATLPPRQRLVVAVSGGVDSMLLLALVRAYVAEPRPAPLSLLAVHVHHGLSTHADAWADTVTRACAALGVALVVTRVRVDQALPSREAAARAARYAALSDLLQPGDALLLGHHADDQAETVLLRLLRGSGLSGLAAMRPVRAWPDLADVVLLRPLLALARLDIVQAATQRGLTWIEDESNADTAYDRNFLRHDVLPVLSSRWPATVLTLAATAQRLADTDALLNDYLDADLAPLLMDRAGGRAGLSVDGLGVHGVSRQRALLRRWLVCIGAPIFYASWLDELLKMARAKADAEGSLRVGGWECHRFRGQLMAFPALSVDDCTRVLAWDLCGALALGAGSGVLVADTAGLALALPAGSVVTVRFRVGGERLAPAGGIGSRPLKKVLHALALPPWLRSRVPLLYINDQLAAVGDLLVDAAFAPTPARPANRWLRWLRPWALP